ncbi:hypothetical protein JHK82_056421 [Glycine max]|nr:hypothetical protein JHK86_056253 [Glycine max]KAG5077726.1 hypothetical protein JHK82_056421 [Glycine max]
MSGTRFLFSNDILLRASDAPPVKGLLETHPGAYTTSRTHNNASWLLFWERHMKRLSQSIQILSNLAPELLFKSNNSAILLPSSATLPIWQPTVQMLVNDSVCKVLPIALKERNDCEELAITTLVSGNLEELNACDTFSEERMSKILDVHVHVETYVPPTFGIWGNGVHLAVVGYGRNVAAAKYSDWVRIRKSLEKLRPPSVTELLLSNDGDQILEGCVTNFFVVCCKERNSNDEKALCDYGNKYSFEVQTAPISDGVLPGTIRQLVLEICRSEGIPFREVAPSWSECEIWEEAFITNSLRLLQHVDSIQVPTEWQSAHSKTWKDISWTKKQFQGGPGMITTIIQEKIMEKAILEGYPISNIYAAHQIDDNSVISWKMAVFLNLKSEQLHE